MDELDREFAELDLPRVKQWIAESREESLTLEFKSVADSELSRDDRKNLAIALSGFANSSGGIVVWGVDCRRNADGVDAAIGLKPTDNLAKLASQLSEFTGEAVQTYAEGVIHKRIPTEGEKGLVATLVPASVVAPHMAMLGEQRYYKRSGGSFYKLEHFDLEDMFGRRQRPVLVLEHAILPDGTINAGSASARYMGKVVLSLRNVGRGIAKFPYFGLEVAAPYRASEFGVDGNRNLGLPKLPGSNHRLHRFGGSADVVIHVDGVLEVTAISFDVLVDTGFARRPTEMRIAYEVAAENARLTRHELVVSADELLCVARDL